MSPLERFRHYKRLIDETLAVLERKTSSADLQARAIAQLERIVPRHAEAIADLRGEPPAEENDSDPTDPSVLDAD